MENEQALIDQAKKGDARAFKELIAAYQSDLYNVALYFTGDTHDASDLYQETWIKVFRNLAGYKYNRNFKAWLLKVLRNTYIDKFSRKRGRKEEVPMDEMAAGMTGDSRLRGPETEERKQIIYRAVNSLPDEFRQTVILVDLQGLSYEDTAGIMNVSTGTVRSRLSRARKKLKEIFLKPGTF